MSGTKTLAAALHALHPAFIGAVPGYPLTKTAELLVASGAAQWINHEAVAVQMAVGVAVDGSTAVAIMKQVGLNAALDVLACAAPHRTGGAVLIVVGDDPGGKLSQVEGDARAVALAIEIPCVEPAGPDDIHAAVAEAAVLSAEHSVPVILRVTAQMMDSPIYSEGQITPIEARPFDATRTWSADCSGQRSMLVSTLDQIAKSTGCRYVSGDRSLRLVASGLSAVEAIRSGCETLVVRRPIPFPEQELEQFAKAACTPLLVLEDGLPLLERDLKRYTSVAIFGRSSGHVPSVGPIDGRLVINAVRSDLQPEQAAPSVQHETESILCGYGTLFDDLVSLDLGPVCCDAGSSFYAAYLTSRIAPLSLGLGSAIGAAAGVALKRGRAIAVIGDMALFHAGVLGLLQVVRDQLPVLTIVLDNGIAALTGGQPHPGSKAGAGQRQVSLLQLAAGLGIDWVHTIKAEQAGDSATLHSLLSEWKLCPCPGLLIIEACA